MNAVTAASGLLRALEDESRKHHVACVSKVHVKMGTLCGIRPEDLKGAFRILSEGTVADGAEMKIGVAPAEARCRHCGGLVGVTSREEHVFLCAECGKPVEKPASGHQVEVSLIRGKARRHC
ncbi:MAG: hydrogenase maturation nickel metallochaperone HypA [Deltaproteobacteria bacterium]|nr:hydrogenase maturation nickel metallochaperone HypA [Deltaproteobacteria bacterium]